MNNCDIYMYYYSAEEHAVSEVILKLLVLFYFVIPVS